jgi:small neutral amino acid transporter SnatA (MarC family)
MRVQQFFGYFFETLASLLTVVNPPIAIPLFVALSGNLTPQQRAKQASRVALYVAIILASTG